MLLIEDDRADAVLVENLIADAVTDIEVRWAPSMAHAERELDSHRATPRPAPAAGGTGPDPGRPRVRPGHPGSASHRARRRPTSHRARRDPVPSASCGSWWALQHCSSSPPSGMW
ncbi:hypothetical protein A4G29_18895 [Mycobacterium kansasii]|nr:hypothetical protein A4G29_18895 [Mycobacterium kansasii]